MLPAGGPIRPTMGILARLSGCSGTEYKREGQTHILCARFLPSLRCSIVELGCTISARFEVQFRLKLHAVIRRGNR